MNEDDDDDELRVEADPLIGRRLADRYEIVSVIGRGGMGVVYKARQLKMDRFVAIKMLHLGKVGDPAALKRFQSEAQAVSRVRHPHTVTLYDFGVTPDGQPYLVMELLQGESFRKILKEGPLPLARAEKIFAQVVEALACAHEHGIVHKDLKPENIILSTRGEEEDWVYVLDFGIAGVISGRSADYHEGAPPLVPTEIIGSPPYMSPEQCAMVPVIDHRTDIYALGICLFEALAGSGTFPFKAKSAMEVMDCHISKTPRSLRDANMHTTTYESLSQVINRALEKRLEKRHQSVYEFRDDLSEAVRKDARRGLQLKDRVDLEAPRTTEFVELNKDVIEELADEDQDMALVSGDRRHYFAKKQGLVEQLKTMIYGDEDGGQIRTETTQYIFHTCPHCGADTQPDLALCLSCGRSLASKDDYSKIRAARGEFSLPKSEVKGAAGAKVTRELTARKAMQKTGRVWVRLTGPILLCFILIAAVFIMSGGVQMIHRALNPGKPAVVDGQ